MGKDGGGDVGGAVGRSETPTDEDGVQLGGPPPYGATPSRAVNPLPLESAEVAPEPSSNIHSTRVLGSSAKCVAGVNAVV